MPWENQQKMPWNNFSEYSQFMQQQNDPGGEQAALAAEMDDGMGGMGGMGGGQQGGLQGLAAQAQGMSAMPPQGGFANVDDANPRKMGFAGGGALNRFGDNPQDGDMFHDVIRLDANGNRIPNQPINQPQNQQNPERPEGMPDFNQAEAEANAAAMENAPDTMQDPNKYAAMMNKMMPINAPWNADVQAGMGRANEIWQEQLQKQQEIVDRANEQIGGGGGFGGGSGGGGGGGGGGRGDTGGGGDDGGGRGGQDRKRPVGDKIIDETWKGPQRPGPRQIPRGDEQILGGPPGLPQIKGQPTIFNDPTRPKPKQPSTSVFPPPNADVSFDNRGGPSAANNWGRDIGQPVDISAAPQGGGQQGGGGWQRQDNQGQQFLDNMKRNFEMMTPQQRMQNAGQFQSDMDKWQSQFGEGGNTRDQVALFDQIKEGTGSQRLRGFPSQNNPMFVVTDQQRQGTFRGTDARLQQPQQPQMQQLDKGATQQWTKQGQPSLQNLSEQAQGTGTGQGMSPAQETPLWQQKMTDDMTTRQKNQIANARYEHYKPTMEVGRTDGLNKVQRNARLNNQRSNQNRQSQGAFSPSQYNPSVASQAQPSRSPMMSSQPSMNQKAPGMRTARAGSGGLNRLSNAAKGSNMMKKPMLTYG
jgi:hypothetical protein